MTLSAPISVDYIHEPFNPRGGLSCIQSPYPYLRAEGHNPKKFALLQQEIEKVFNYDFNLETVYYPSDSTYQRWIKRVMGSRGPFYLCLAKLNPFRKATVIKDPLGCFLTEYLAQKYQVKVIVLVRHPVAFVASTRRLEWHHKNFRNLAIQEHLVEDYFPDEVDFLQKQWSTPLEAAAALWRILNKVLLAQVSQHPDWVVLKHEHLSNDPLNTFRGLYQGLKLPWSNRIENLILRRTNAANQTEAKSGKSMDINRNSVALFEHRISQIAKKDRRTVYELTKDVALGMYSEDSFSI